MAQRDDLGRFLRAHDAGHAGNGQRIALGEVSGKDHVDDIIATAIERPLRQKGLKATGELVLGQTYTRKDVSRVLSFGRESSRTLYGYGQHVAAKSMSEAKLLPVCPLFITYQKSNNTDQVAESIAYRDRFINRTELIWETRQITPRTARADPESSDSLEWRIAAGDFHLPVFIKRDKTDGNRFYFVGYATPDAAQVITRGDRNYLEMHLIFPEPVPLQVYNYLHLRLADDSDLVHPHDIHRPDVIASDSDLSLAWPSPNENSSAKEELKAEPPEHFPRM